MKKSKWIGMCLAVLAGALILIMPAPASLSRAAQSVLGITAFTILLWLSRVMNSGVASVLMMGLMILTGSRPQLVLSGFSSPSFWILLAVLYYGCAMSRTGLAQRLSYYILSLFPGTYAGILAAFFMIGLVLAFGIPSMTVRTAIVVPLAWALVQALEIAPRSKGAALIMLTSIEMAVVPGYAFLYGSLYGPVVDSVFHVKHFPLSWLEYAKVMTLPTLIFCVVLLLGNQWVMKPETRLKSSRSFVKERLRTLGPLKHSELITASVVLLSIAYWATDRIHHMPSFLVGMFGLAVFAVAGVIRDEDIAGGVSWTLLLFIGGIFGLANVIQEYRITDWLAGYFVPIAKQLTFSSIVVLAVMALAMLALRFLDPTGFIAMPVLFLPIVDIMIPAGIPPLIFIAPLLLSSAPFWLSYQNIWVAMGEGMIGNQGFSAGQRALLSHVHGVAILVTLVISVVYWRLIGLL
jgi:anion transporter